MYFVCPRVLNYICAGFPGSSVFKLLVVVVALTAAHGAFLIFRNDRRGGPNSRLFFSTAAARHGPNEQERTINLNQYIDNMKARVNQDMVAMKNNQNLPVQARCVTSSASGFSLSLLPLV